MNIITLLAVLAVAAPLHAEDKVVEHGKATLTVHILPGGRGAKSRADAVTYAGPLGVYVLKNADFEGGAPRRYLGKDGLYHFTGAYEAATVRYEDAKALAAVEAALKARVAQGKKQAGEELDRRAALLKARLKSARIAVKLLEALPGGAAQAADHADTLARAEEHIAESSDAARGCWERGRQADWAEQQLDHVEHRLKEAAQR